MFLGGYLVGCGFSITTIDVKEMKKEQEPGGTRGSLVCSLFLV